MAQDTLKKQVQKSRPSEKRPLNVRNAIVGAVPQCPPLPPRHGGTDVGTHRERRHKQKYEESGAARLERCVQTAELVFFLSTQETFVVGTPRCGASLAGAAAGNPKKSEAVKEKRTITTT